MARRGSCPTGCMTTGVGLLPGVWSSTCERVYSAVYMSCCAVLLGSDASYTIIGRKCSHVSALPVHPNGDGTVWLGEHFFQLLFHCNKALQSNVPDFKQWKGPFWGSRNSVYLVLVKAQSFP